jgi:hypothetical protein
MHPFANIALMRLNFASSKILAVQTIAHIEASIRSFFFVSITLEVSDDAVTFPNPVNNEPFNTAEQPHACCAGPIGLCTSIFEVVNGLVCISVTVTLKTLKET